MGEDGGGEPSSKQTKYRFPSNSPFSVFPLPSSRSRGRDGPQLPRCCGLVILAVSYKQAGKDAGLLVGYIIN